MNKKNEKYEHYKDFWILENKTESKLFWQLEESGYDACDINVIHAIRKWESIIMWRKVPKGKHEFEWTMGGLPESIEKHTPVTADQVWKSIEKLLTDKIIKSVNKKIEEKYNGKQRKFTLTFDIDVRLIRELVASQSTIKLF